MHGSAYKCGSSVSPNRAARRAGVYNVVASVLLSETQRYTYGARLWPPFGSITSSSVVVRVRPLT